jgi:hypothetical protein
MGASIFFTAAMIRQHGCIDNLHCCNDPSTGCIDNLHCCDDPCPQARIIAAVKNIDEPMLTRVWQELEYRIDVCRVTRDAHIENL